MAEEKNKYITPEQLELFKDLYDVELEDKFSTVEIETDEELSPDSKNPVQNKAIYAGLEGKQDVLTPGASITMDNNVIGVVSDDTVDPMSDNPVKGKAIAQYMDSMEVDFTIMDEPIQNAQIAQSIIVGNVPWNLGSKTVMDMIAPAYDSTSTYEIGDAVIYQNKLYKCVSTISMAEQWNPEHWAQTTLAELLRSQVTAVIGGAY